jgi:hypothetical protein
MPYFCNWRELFASAGYLTISPNYRGSQGRGSTFAATANAGIGLYDWPDCESMVDEVIRRGWADSDRLGVAGWSHGMYNDLKKEHYKWRLYRRILNSLGRDANENTV